MHKINKKSYIKKKKKILFSAFDYCGTGYVANIFTMAWAIASTLGIVPEFFSPLLINIIPSPYMILGFLIIIFCFAYFYYNYKTYESYKLTPYERKQNFISIYTLEEFRANPTHFVEKLIGRSYELNYLHDRIIDICNHASDKRAICLTGQSGTGKSTIVNMFMDKYKDNYHIFYCSANYNFLLDKLKSWLWVETYHDAVSEIEKKAVEKSIVLIFDQFENFFLLQPNEQSIFINDFLGNLTLNNVAIIFTLKSDNLHNLMSNMNLKIGYQKRLHKGVLYLFDKDIIEVPINTKQIETNSGFLFIGKEENPKYAQNRNDRIIGLCQSTFNDNWEKVYEFIKDSRIIEQQIILSIFENENDDAYIDSLIKKNNISDILSLYFDRQLCSTNHHYESMQIIYLLSLGRKYGRTFTIDQIRAALLNSKERNDIVKQCLNSLTDMKLIKFTQEGGSRYEITHDYIADKSIEYCNKELDNDSRAILEFYCSNCENKKYSDYVNKVIQAKGRPIWLLNTFLILVVMWILSRFFVHRLALEHNDYSFCIPLAAISSVIFGYGLYANIMRNHPSLIRRAVHFVLVIVIPCVFVFIGIEYYNSFVFAWFGIGIISIGIALITVQINNTLVKIAKAYFFNYGGKVVLIGVVVIGFGLLFNLVTSEYFNYNAAKIYIQFIPYMLIVLYSYVAQLNKRYYFSCLGIMNQLIL